MKKYKVWYYLQTAIGYGIYNSFADLEKAIPRYIELGFEIDFILTIEEEK